VNYADIVSVTENQAVFSWQLDAPGFAELQLDGRSFRSAEAAGVGRFTVDGLAPDTAYTAELSGVRLAFRTLPAPQSAELFRFAVIADPHVSAKAENRKGRLMVESAGLFADALKQAKASGAAFAVLPGDLTNAGTPEEYEIVAEILKNSSLEVWNIPGNHDKVGSGLWEQKIGARRWLKTFAGVRFLGIDTAGAELTQEDARTIQDELTACGKTILFSHYQLFEAPRIRHKPLLGIRNKEQYGTLLENLAATPSFIFAGHQNICSVFRKGACVQVNLAQIVQFPCCFQLVRVFAEGLAVHEIPIRSEVLRQWSRTAENLAAEFYAEPQWDSSYRLGNFEQSNFFWKGAIK